MLPTTHSYSRLMHTFTDASHDLVRRVADLCIDRLSMDAPLDHSLTPAELQATAGATVTEDGIGQDKALHLWENVLAPACISTDNPRVLCFIPAAPTKSAAAFDMLVGASSIFGGSWMEGAGAVYAENQALRWIADIAGMPESTGGVFVSGGTAGNLSALVAARSVAARKRERPARWAVVLTDETHSSVKHLLTSVMDVDVIKIPGDERGRLTGAAIRAWAETSDRLDDVFAVVATAGTTNLGVVDDLAGIADVAQEHDWWFHVDGAYGGAGLAAPSVRELYAGIERADSFIVDPHKWLFAPYDCCALLYRDPVVGRAAHTQYAGYLDIITSDTEWNPSDFAVHLSRRARGLPFWFSLATHGTRAYSDAIEQTLSTAREGRRLIDEADHVRLLVEPDLSVLIFERVGWDDADYGAWSRRLLDAGTAFVTPTKHHGKTCTRFAIINPRTTVDDLRMILDSMV